MFGLEQLGGLGSAGLHCVSHAVQPASHRLERRDTSSDSLFLFRGKLRAISVVLEQGAQ
jgi:hypothetical protein